MHLDLYTDDPEAEIERLIGIGATRHAIPLVLLKPEPLGDPEVIDPRLIGGWAHDKPPTKQATAGSRGTFRHQVDRWRGGKGEC